MPQIRTSKSLSGSSPAPFIDRNVRKLMQYTRDVITGAVGTSITVENPIIDGLELVFKNGVLLTPSVQYTVDADGLGITLGSAAIAGDYYVVQYYYRSTRS